MTTPSPPAQPRDPIAPIIHENLDDKIYASLRDMLASGRFEPGRRIVQEELAASLGVSRTPLINALKRLAQEGLLEWIPRRGIFVRQLTLTELISLFEVRERLEPLAAELAAPRIAPEEAARLEAQWRAMGELPDTPESHRLFVDLDRRFHWRLTELAGNPYLAAAMAPVNMLAAAYLHGTPRPWSDTVADHLAITQALSCGDAPACAEAMRRHITQSLDALRLELSSRDAPENS